MKPRRERSVGWASWCVGILLAVLLLPGCAQNSTPALNRPGGEQGRWITESGNLEIEIAPCGQTLCGTVVQVLGNRSMSKRDAAMTPVDSRPALGMEILTGFTPSGRGEWKGSIYNRENGKTYRCLMALLENGELEIHPYVGLPLFGKTQIWHRASDSGTPAH